MAGDMDPKSESLLRELLRNPENKAVYETMCDTQVELPLATERDRLETLHDTMRKIMNTEAVRSRKRILAMRIVVAASVVICLGVVAYQLFRPGLTEQWVDYYCRAGGFTTLPLSDGSCVYVNSESRLHYPVRFLGRQRSVELDGEAYFEVAENPDKPFVVHTDLIDVRVVGTSFNIKSYKSDSLIYATLVEGCIELTVNGTEGNYILKPNEQACISKCDGKVTIAEIDPDFDTGWKDGYLTFYKMKFSEICQLLQRRYGYLLNVEDSALLETVFTGRFVRGENIFQVLDVIRHNTPFDYSVGDDRVITITVE